MRNGRVFKEVRQGYDSRRTVINPAHVVRAYTSVARPYCVIEMAGGAVAEVDAPFNEVAAWLGAQYLDPQS